MKSISIRIRSAIVAGFAAAALVLGASAATGEVTAGTVTILGGGGDEELISIPVRESIERRGGGDEELISIPPQQSVQGGGDEELI